MSATLVGGALALAGQDVEPTFTWLDGGAGADRGRGWLGLRAAEQIVADDLEPLEEVERRWRSDPDSVWLGWLTYDLGAGLHMRRPARRGRLPGLCVRRFDASVRFGPSGARLGGRKGAVAELAGALETAPAAPASAWPFEPLRAPVSAADYRARVDAARRHIASGDTYQINLSQRFEARWAAGCGGASDVAAAYASLRDRAPATMGGLVRWEGGWVVSNSPETLIDVRRGPGGVDVARSWPIKGTRPRGGDPRADRDMLRALATSAKDRAEHVMIVDLVRNDLGRLAIPGTVRAAPEPEVVTLPTVHHLVTEVRADLRPGWTLRGLVEAMFPGGSITGAPKHRTIELIDELEGESRELYCGSLFVLDPDGLRFDIAIRTAWVDDDGLTVRGGGGIVIDSDPESERLETIAKVRAFEAPGQRGS